MHHKSHTVGTAICLGFLLASEASASLISYTFAADSFAPTTVAANVTATPVNDTGSSASLTTGPGLPDALFLSQRILSTTPAAAVANNQFFQFTVTPDTGFALDLTSLTFDGARGGDSTPRGFVLRSSLDGFSADIATGTFPTVAMTLTNFSIDLSGAVFQGISTDTIFRFYGFAPQAGGSGVIGSWYDNLTLNGQVTAVPEPSAAVISLAGIALLGSARWWQRAKLRRID